MINTYVSQIDENGNTNLYRAIVKGWAEYYDHLECGCFDVVMIKYKEHTLSVYCDDEGMMKPNFGRIIGNYPQPIFGNVVITGGVDDEGETLSVPEELSMLDMYEIIGDVKWVCK